jgi:hypothetical protein
MATGLPSNPDWASPALQGLSYWLGSQHALGLAANISEGAIAWELSRLLFAHRDARRVLEAEVLYRDIPEYEKDASVDGSLERADLVISRQPRSDRDIPYEKGDIEAVVEIKHNRSQKRLLWKDIDRLGRRRATTKRIRAFLIYASVNERPSEFTQAGGGAVKPRTRPSPSGTTNYRVRRVCRATARIPGQNVTAVGHYAILIEVAPSHITKKS